MNHLSSDARTLISDGFAQIAEMPKEDFYRAMGGLVTVLGTAGEQPITIAHEQIDAMLLLAVSFGIGLGGSHANAG